MTSISNFIMTLRIRRFTLKLKKFFNTLVGKRALNKETAQKRLAKMRQISLSGFGERLRAFDRFGNELKELKKSGKRISKGDYIKNFKILDDLIASGRALQHNLEADMRHKRAKEISGQLKELKKRRRAVLEEAKSSYHDL